MHICFNSKCLTDLICNYVISYNCIYIWFFLKFNGRQGQYGIFDLLISYTAHNAKFPYNALSQQTDIYGLIYRQPAKCNLDMHSWTLAALLASGHNTVKIFFLCRWFHECLNCSKTSATTIMDTVHGYKEKSCISCILLA